jgi:hypothetical protein
VSDWIYWNKKYEVNLTVRDIIERAKKEGRNLKDVLKGIRICDPIGGKTSIYCIGRLDEEKKMVFGSETEDDGDWLNWSQSLDKILGYFDTRTLSFEWPPRYQPLSLQEVRAKAID